MYQECVTDGEKLCHFIEHRLLSHTEWDILKFGLEYTGRQSELIDFFRQFTTVSLTGRLVIGGASLAKQVDINDLQFQQSFQDFLCDNVQIPSHILDEIYRFAFRAVQASREKISDTLGRRFKNWAQKNHPHCYMCGVLLDFNTSDSERSYICEYLWPQAYGGNSVEENLLPACHSCSRQKRGHSVTWVMPVIQSLIMGLNPAPEQLQDIEGCYKFALYYKAIQKFAAQKQLILKQAFLQAGPWTEVRVSCRDDVADFFNLENYPPHLHLGSTTE